jgi:hypothetical protein
MLEKVEDEFVRSPNSVLVYMNIRDLQNSIKMELDGEIQFKSLLCSLPESVETPIKNDISKILNEMNLEIKEKQNNLRFSYWVSQESRDFEKYKVSKYIRQDRYFEIMKLIINRLEIVYHEIGSKSSASNVLL